MHGREEAAEASFKEIEDDVAATKGQVPPVDSSRELEIRPNEQIGYLALFKAGALNAVTQTLCWTVIFYFASAGASAGYLTVSEIFLLEVRAKAIAVFFAIAQCFGSLGSHCTAT